VRVAAVAVRTVPGLMPLIVRRLGSMVGILPLLPLFALGFMPQARNAGSPLAYLMLALFTAFEGLAVGAFTWALPLALITRAATATAVATGGLTVYALTTRRDFSALGGMLTAGLLGLMTLGVLQIFMPGPLIHSARAAFGVLLFCGYIVVNTQV
jgi:FtsH-binding integral membrane protein